MNLYMMVGLPYSGKSTWIKDKMHDDTDCIASYDDIIQKIADEKSITYNEAYKTTNYRFAIFPQFSALVKEAIKNCNDIFIDNTSLRVSSRKKYFDLFTKKELQEYTKIAVVLNLDYATYRIRCEKRHNKVIPINTMLYMSMSYQEPTLGEGFDEIVNIGGLYESYRFTTY